jgi:ZIP family zinc transporter
MLSAGAWAFLAASSLLLGAFIAQTVTVPRSIVRDAMAFGAGALIGALAYELIPDKNLSDVQIWLSFGAGALVFYGLDGLIQRRSTGGQLRHRDRAGPVHRPGFAIAAVLTTLD